MGLHRHHKEQRHPRPKQAQGDRSRIQYEQPRLREQGADPRAVKHRLQRGRQERQ